MKNKPIHLLFDASPMASNKKSGVGFYTERLLHALATKYPDDLQITAHYFNFLGRKQLNLPSYKNVEYRRTSLFPSKILNILRRFGIELPMELFVREKGDFVLFPNFVGYPLLRKTPVGVVIHDLSYIDYPEYVQGPNRNHLLRYVPRSIKRSRLLIAVSETTKQAIQHAYEVDELKIMVTTIPVPKNPAKPVKHPKVSGKFILFVGTLEPRKNFAGLVQAYMLLPEKTRKEYGLVLAGGNGWFVEKELAEIRRLQDSGENIVTTGYFSDEEKAWMLQNASLFVQPSHYEGFGMPILEAMDAGAPTIVSDIPIFREVSGEASLFFNQNDPLSISKAISTVLDDMKLQAKLSKLGKAQSSKYNWDTIAEELYERISAEVQQ